MSNNRQPQLNGAYYGPSIPPTKTYHSHGRHGSSCNPCSCLFNCICTCVFQLLCTLLVIVGIAVLVLWLIFRPNTPKFYATEATLTEFNIDNNNTLHYNLALNFTIRNPNSRIGIRYDTLEARAYYQGQRFAIVELQPFHQGTKNTRYESVVFRGQQLVLLNGGGISNYNSERSVGVYDVDVRINLRMRMNFAIVRRVRFRSRVNCNDLRVPLTSTGGTPAVNGVYQQRRCGFHWRR